MTICFLKEREDNLIFALLATAAPEVRVGEAEGVVETDDRVELDGERLKVGLGLLDLDRGAGGRRGDERRGDREAGESDGELLRWGYGGKLFLSCVDEHANRCVRDCKLVCIQTSARPQQLWRSNGCDPLQPQRPQRAAARQDFSCGRANAELSGAHAKWLLVLHQCQRGAVAMALIATRRLRRGDRTLRRARFG